MISYVSGNLFESPAQTLVNTVNTVGVMGKGIALRFKQIYPDMFRHYQELCEKDAFAIGSLFLWRTPHKLVLNFPTKQHWRHPSKPEYIERGLQTFVRMYEHMGIHSIAFPPLGCGNGELDFRRQVQPLMQRYLADLPIQVFIYAPQKNIELPEHRQPSVVKAWLNGSPQDLSFTEVWADLSQLLQSRQAFETLKKGNRFEAQFIPDHDEVRVWAAGRRTMAVDRDEMCVIWQQLRTTGLLTRGALGERARDSAYLFPLLAELPYVTVVALSDTFQDFNINPTFALQLSATAVSDDRQRELGLA